MIYANSPLFIVAIVPNYGYSSNEDEEAYHVVNCWDPMVRVEKSPQALHETFLEGNEVDAHPVVRHRVGLGLEAGAGQRLVDVLLQVVQRLLHRTKVRGGHQRGQLMGELWMAADDCGEDLDELDL